ncbi:right-handed parallel beta-helix repeat-containing protein [Bacteroidota bacterium]
MENSYKIKLFARTLILLLLAAGGLANAQTIIYVSADGSGDGSSWASTTADIQAAINTASEGTDIWIKAGTYYTPGDLNFELVDGVSLYGGFAGTETNPLQRTDYRMGGTNETILSADIDKNGINDAGNATRVMYGEDITSATTLNGLTIRDGYADVPEEDGGGLRLNGGNMNIENCTFAYNYCADNGAGLYLYNAATLTVSDCYFTANFADDKAGAAYTATGCDAVFTNCVFENNSADTDAGAFRAYRSAPTLINCTFTRNTLTNGDGSAADVNTAPAAATFINCVFWGNLEAGSLDSTELTLTTNATATITNCAFQGTYTATGATVAGIVDISSTDPLFTNTSGTAGHTGYNAAADWSIKTGSPLINAGTASGAPQMDMNKEYRVANPDIGAFEFGTVAPFIIATDINGPGTISPYGAYVASGDNQAFILTPSPGYEITAATYSSADILSAITDNGDGSFGYTVTAVNANGMLAVTFSALVGEFTVTVTAGANGSIDPTGDLKMTAIDETVFTITPDAGYLVGTFEFNGTSVLDKVIDNGDGTFSYTLTGVGETSTLSVNFTKVYTLTASASANGSIDPYGDTFVTVSDTTEFTVTPASGYIVGTFTLNSSDVSGDLTDNGDGTYTYTLSAVNADATIAVTFIEHMGNITYIKAGGTGDGSSWANAAGSIQDALLASSFGDQVWVAAGIYLTPDNKVDSSFTLVNGVSLYGGFAGTETSKNQRSDFRMGMANETKLSADLDGNGFLTGGNASRVIFGEFISPATTIDGFTITGGFSDVAGSNGAGMKLRASSPNVVNCTFFDSYCDDGTLLYLYRSGEKVSSPIVKNCYFIKGYANDDGGAIYNASGTRAKYINCVFANNFANDEGGAIRNFECSPEFYNCTFVYNALADVDPTGGGTYGAAIRNYQGAAPYMNTEPKFVNCVIWRNQDGSAEHSYDISNTGAMATAGAFVTVINCAIMDSLSSSCIVTDTVDIGPADGSYVNPGFVDISGSPGYQGYSPLADWNIVSTSVLIGRGTNTEADVPTFDIRGERRGDVIDIGAYENGIIIGIKQVDARVDFDVLVFPNPSDGSFAIQVKDGNITELHVIDIYGRVLERFENLDSGTMIPVNLSQRSSGLYFLKMKNSKGQVSTQKVILK